MQGAFASVEDLCAASRGDLQGLNIDLHGCVLKLDGSYRCGANLSKQTGTRLMYDLVFCGPGTCIHNGTLQLADDVVLVIQHADVVLQDLTIKGECW